MFTIEQKHYGLKIVFKGLVDKEEMERWVLESEIVLKAVPEGFSVLVDLRHLQPLPDNARDPMERGQRLYKEKGMERSAVILDSEKKAGEYRKLAEKSGIASWERYICSEKSRNWEEAALDWLLEGTDPE